MATKLEIIATHNGIEIPSAAALRLIADACGYGVDQVETILYAAYNGDQTAQKLLRELIELTGRVV